MVPIYDITYKVNDVGNLIITAVRYTTGKVIEIEIVNGKLNLKSLTIEQLDVITKIYEWYQNEEINNVLLDKSNPN